MNLNWLTKVGSHADVQNRENAVTPVERMVRVQWLIVHNGASEKVRVACTAVGVCSTKKYPRLSLHAITQRTRRL